MVALCKTCFGTCGVYCFIDNYGVSKRGDNRLLYLHITANRTVVSRSETGTSTGGSNSRIEY